MIDKDSVEAAYCFFHQKMRIYIHSTIPSQKDDIEYAISSYADAMNKELYILLSEGKENFLTDHTSFLHDISQAIEQLEQMM